MKNQDLNDKKAHSEFGQMIQSLFQEKVSPGLELSKLIGNIYTGSLYLSLASLIDQKSQEELIGKRILMYSYGSGVSTTLFSIRVLQNFEKEELIDSVSIINNFKN